MPWRRNTAASHGISRLVPQDRRVHAWKSLTRGQVFWGMMLLALARYSDQSIVNAGRGSCRAVAPAL
jgi:hypothetical protein